MSETAKHYDFIIVGSGAGGATVAHQLAYTGKSILILERGEDLPIEDQNWDPSAVFVDHRYRTDEVWFDKEGDSFNPSTHYWVGGNTTFYGAVLMRFRESDFQYTEHHGGISPAWPITYQDLAPYYDRAEQLWQVRGTRGTVDADPLDPGTVAYPASALDHDHEVADLCAHFSDMGWTPFKLPLGVMRDNAQPAMQGGAPPNHCIRCTTCGGYPCKIKAKCDARTISIDPIRGLQNVTLKTGHKVRRLLTDDTGQIVTGVYCITADGPVTYTSETVILAAGAVNSAVILLKSANDHHPDGLANGSDQVGRNYMFHTMTATVSLSLHETMSTFPKTLGINDFYHKDPSGGFDFPMGHIQLLEYMAGQTIEGQLADSVPDIINRDWLLHLIPDAVSDEIAEHALAFLTISEDLPLPENRVHLTNQGITIDYHYNNLAGHQRLVKYLDHALDTFHHHGSRFSIIDHHFQISKLLPLYGTAHQCGTTRMGENPATSVVDAHCKAHELDNLYIVDSGVFVSAAAVNPTLTIVANAMRVADHLIARCV